MDTEQRTVETNGETNGSSATARAKQGGGAADCTERTGEGQARTSRTRGTPGRGIRLRKGTELRLRAERLDERGLGVGQPPDCGLSVHVPDLLPGETARVVVSHVSVHAERPGGRAFAEVQKREVAAPERVTPACAGYGRCGGCTLQHLEESAQLRYKTEQLALALGSLQRPGDGGALPLRPCVPSPSALYYRSRVKLVAQARTGTERSMGAAGIPQAGNLVPAPVLLGSYAPRSHHVVDMSGCRVNARALTALARTLSTLWSRAGLPIFQEGETGKGQDNGGRDPRTDRGGLRYVLLREVRSGALQLSLVLGAPLPDGDARLRPLLSELCAAHPALASVVLHINSSRGNSLLVTPSESGEFGKTTESDASARAAASNDSLGDPLGPEESDRELLGSSYLWEELSCPRGSGPEPAQDGADPLANPLRLRVSARSFLQVNRALAARLYSDVARALRVQPGETVLDLYCGVSGLGRTVLRTQPAARLVGIEWSASAIADARASAESSTEPAARAARFLCGGVAEVLPEVLREITGPAGGPSVVLLNPPRRGSEPAVLEALLAAAPRAIGYVSCNPHSLARDLRTLMDAGYRPTSITPYDMHPGTPHIETVTILEHAAGPTP